MYLVYSFHLSKRFPGKYFKNKQSRELDRRINLLISKKNYLCPPMGPWLSWFRASALHAEGRKFESCRAHIVQNNTNSFLWLSQD